jgi:SPP1 family phage portal protein
MAFEKSVNSNIMRYPYMFGRYVLKSSLKEDELTPENILIVLKDVLPLHFENRKQIDYLRDYYEGNQDIIVKVKEIREDINNRVVENTAFHLVEFKKGFVFGDPIQYVQKSETNEAEINKFNYYMAENAKASLDSTLSEDFYLYGTSFRMIFPSKAKNKPFEIFNAEPRDTNVVYSTGYRKTPLFAFYITEKYDYSVSPRNIYYLITVYTKSKAYTFKTNTGAFQLASSIPLAIDLIPDEKPESEVNWQGEIPIIEYPLNKSRLGIVELVKSGLDTLNRITSNDIDGIEQFIQSLLIFMNVDIDSTQFKEMIQAGAVKLKSSEGSNVKSDIKSIVNQLQHSETKILWDRIYNNLLNIAGVPRMSDKASSGDTGQARLVGEGWTMADQRAKQDELAFKLSEKELITRALNICKNISGTEIKDLVASDINIKFTRNKSDNILVKTQALMNMKAAQIDPETAFSTVDLFSDPNEVYKLALLFYGDDLWKVEDKNMVNGNTVKNTEEVATQLTVE